MLLVLRKGIHIIQVCFSENIIFRLKLKVDIGAYLCLGPLNMLSAAYCRLYFRIAFWYKTNHY